MNDGRSRHTPVRLLALGVALLVGGVASGDPEGSAGSFRLVTTEPGVYRLAFEQLRDAGLKGPPLPADRLSLSSGGRAVHWWLDGGEDGAFGPGDALEFVATRLTGPHSHFHSYSRHNVYWLTVERDAPGLPDVAVTRAGDAGGVAGGVAWRRLHLEEQELLVRLGRAAAEGMEPELWFWHKLTHLDREPTRVAFDLESLDPVADTETELTLQFRGLSSRRSPERAVDGLSDHRVDVVVNGRSVGALEWNGKSVHRERIRIGRDVAVPDANNLELRVSPRRPPDASDPIVDVVVLDWVEVRYPYAPRLEGEQRLVEAFGTFREELSVATPGGTLFAAYDDLGRRWLSSVGAARTAVPAVGATRLWLVPEGAYRKPLVELDRPSSLAGDDLAADYLIIAHPSLREAVEPLAELHRKRGLRVVVADARDVYDEFNHGIEHPVAIRRLVAHAYFEWRAPRLKYVLLVGDASWDRRGRVPDDSAYANWADRQLLQGRRFPVKDYTPYDEPGERGLLPSWNYHAYDGHSASDNWFATVDGEDFYPDVAIARFPVTTPAEVERIVAKSIRYSQSSAAAEWRRRTLWVTNEQPRFQARADRVASAVARRGFAVEKVYPDVALQADEKYQEQLVEALDAGVFLVYFNGHGGRFIWRTAAPTIDRRHPDLFTLEHVDALRPNEALPVVLSLSCHTGPFDHPAADSIGEKLLRVADRGAIAVVSASWRTTVADPLALAFAESFTEAGTIGDAFQKAKRRLANEFQVATYNLFGDPALELALPVPPGDGNVRDAAVAGVHRGAGPRVQE